MSVSPIGYLAIAWGLLAFVRRPMWLFFAAVFFAPFSACAVVNLPSFGFNISLFFFLCFILAVACGQGPRLKLRVTRTQFLLIALVLLFYFACLSSLWTPLLGDRLITRTISVATFLAVGVSLTVLTTLLVNDVDRLLTTVKVQMAGAVFASAWGLVQFACYFLGIPYPSFIFNTSASHSADLFATGAGDGFVRIGSVAVEPSILVQSLAFPLAIAATLLSYKAPVLRRWCFATVILSTTCIVLSTSTTGYIGLGVLALLLLAQRPRRTIPALILAAPFAVLPILLMPGFVAAIVDTTLDKSQSWSYAHRSATLIDGLKAFTAHPIIGSGVGAQSVSSLPVYLLGNAGILGTMCFVILVLSTLFALRTIRVAQRLAPTQRSDQPAGVGVLWPALPNAMTISLVMQSVAGFTYAFPDFWIALGLMIATVGVGGRSFKKDPTDALVAGEVHSRSSRIGARP